MTSLDQLGWNPYFERAFAPFVATGVHLRGRVSVEDRQAFVLLTERGTVTATLPRKLAFQADSNVDLPKVGDWVVWQQIPEEDRGQITQVLTRRTWLARKVAGEKTHPQILAANLDTAFIVQALDRTFNPRRIERFLVMVHEGGARPVVILNKADLCRDPKRQVLQAREAAGNAPVLVVSAETSKGLDSLSPFVAPGHTIAFLGSSGVGKSTLINRLYGANLQPTLEVRAHDAKGRHATTWRELIVLPQGGLVIDTPGLREFQMWIADDGLSSTFPDIEQLGVACQFRDCSHQCEQGCSVLAALQTGQLTRGRYESYQRLRRELAYLSQERLRHTYRRRDRRPRPSITSERRILRSRPDDDMSHE